MASLVGLDVLLRNARLNAITTFAGNAAKLRIYAGTRPATGGTATTLLAEFVLGSPMAGAAASGVLTLNSVSSVAAVATGTATYARIVKSDGTTFVADLSVGVSGADVNINTVSIVQDATIAFVSGTITEGNA